MIALKKKTFKVKFRFSKLSKYIFLWYVMHEAHDILFYPSLILFFIILVNNKDKLKHHALYEKFGMHLYIDFFVLFISI